MKTGLEPAYAPVAPHPGHGSGLAIGSGDRSNAWWENPWFLLLIVASASIPLLWPQLPPLTDLPGHVGRYHVQLGLHEGTALEPYYDFRWALTANLGVDLLVQLLAPLVGLEPAVKLVILSIPVLTATGFLWTAREVHGRVPATAFFSLPLGYAFPFMMGFVNFALSMALAFLAFAFWLRLGRTGRTSLRALAFVPLGALVWLCHIYGWAVLCVLVFSAELAAERDRDVSWVERLLRAAISSLPLAPPFLLMAMWRTDGGDAPTGDWLNLQAKALWAISALRDRWLLLDLLSIGLLFIVVLDGFRSKFTRLAPSLAIASALLLAIYLLLPRILLGSAYADMRLVPYLIAAAILAVRFRPEASPALIGSVVMVALAFVAVRTAGTTASLWIQDRENQAELAALDQLPPGARMVAFVTTDCGMTWNGLRLTHLPSLAISRRGAFSNDQWTLDGAQLLSIRHPAGEPFTRDPSQIVTTSPCPGGNWLTLEEALARLPRGAFDHVWLIRPGPYDPALVQDFVPVWQNGTSILYRIS